MPQSPQTNIRFRPWSKSGVKGVVFHDTGGSTLSSAVATLNARGLAYNIIVDRDGSIVQFVPSGMSGAHAGTFIRSEYRNAGLGNDNMLGVAYVGGGPDDITPAQLAAAPQLAKYIRDNFPDVNPGLMLGHGEFTAGHRDALEGAALRDAVRESLGGGLRFDAEANPFDNPAPPDPGHRIPLTESQQLEMLGTSPNNQDIWNAVTTGSLDSPFFSFDSGPQVSLNPVSASEFRAPYDDAFFRFDAGGISQSGDFGFGNDFTLGQNLNTNFTGPEYGESNYQPSGPETGYGESTYYETTPDVQWDNPESFDVPSTGVDTGQINQGGTDIANFGGDLSLGGDLNAGFDLGYGTRPTQNVASRPRQQSIGIGSTTNPGTQIGSRTNPIYGLGEQSGKRYYNVGNGWVPFELSYGGNFSAMPGEHQLGGNFIGIDPATGRPVYNPQGYGSMQSLGENAGQKAWGDRNWSMGMGPDGWQPGDAMHEFSGGFRNDPNQGQEQQARDPVKFGMNVGGDAGMGVYGGGNYRVMNEDGALVPYQTSYQPTEQERAELLAWRAQVTTQEGRAAIGG